MLKKVSPLVFVTAHSQQVVGYGRYSSVGKLEPKVGYCAGQTRGFFLFSPYSIPHGHQSPDSLGGTALLHGYDLGQDSKRTTFL